MNTKISKLFAGAILLGLWACSGDEPASIPTGGDHKAYLAVDIRDANSNTRAESESGPEFADGEDFESFETSENKISSSLFVFFDASGHYMCTGEMKSGEFGAPGADNEGGSVEKIGRNIIVLSGLNGIDYPRYMLTVLNDPAGLREDIESNRYTMAQTQQLIPTYVPSATTSFMMTTSTHGGKDSMVTDLANYTLYSQEPTVTDVADTNWVKVYVERLAAAVEMQIGSYSFTLPGEFHVGEMKDGAMQYNNETLSVKIEGWGLNATARESFLSKDIAGLSNQLGNWTWDNPDFHRSYWGTSVYYGKDLESDYTYLGKDGITTPYYKDANNDVIHTLQYYNWAQLGHKFKGQNDAKIQDYRAYCLENTNTVGKITNSNGKLLSKNVTNAIVKATLIDGSGKAVDAIRYQGILFKRSSFIPYALSLVDGAGRLPYYVYVGESTDEAGKPIKNYEQLGADSFELRLTGEGTGVVSVYSNIPDGTTIYKLSKVNNNEIYTEMTDISEINQNLRAVIGTAMAYTDGAMFYVVPIRHLRENADKTTVLEGQYGIVRNHLYQITVNKIETLGHGVFAPGTGSTSSSNTDPGEPIIPDDPDPEFYVSARINILAWKVVNQSVDF